MKTGNCLTVPPGEPLTDLQKTGLDLIARLYGGRDVILAIDLTGSVNFNDHGRTRLRQIIEDSLKSGDNVHVVPFGSDIDRVSEPILFKNNADIDAIIKAIPWESNPDVRNTDIQKAEAFVYPKLARLNQCRLSENEAIKAQSVVWITDAPLNTPPGINSERWIETPKDSPFRNRDSAESIERENWLKALRVNELNTRSQNIAGSPLSVVDVAPTVQEFCTPAPGGEKTCLVDSYIFDRLWLPVTGILALGLIGIVAGILGIRHALKLQKTWTVKAISDLSDEAGERFFLKPSEKITIGGEGRNTIECKGEEIKGYLERRGNQLYLKPVKGTSIYYRGKEVTGDLKIESNTIPLTYTNNNRDFEIQIQIFK